CRHQTLLAPAAPSTPTSRDFVHWRFADAGCRRAGQGRRGRHPQTFTIPDLSICSKLRLFDDLIGAGEQRQGDRYAERFGRLEIDDQREFGRELDWKVSWFLALKYPVGSTYEAALA